MNKVALITNIPAPYRLDLFYYMQTHIKKYEFYVIYTNENEENRSWKIQKDKLINSHILRSQVIKLRGSVDYRYIHIPANIGKCLSKINPDAVIAWEYNPAALQTLWWCRNHHKKFIHLTDGTLFSERNISRIQKLTRKIITKNCDAAIASSTKAREKLVAWGVASNRIFMSLLTVDISPYLDTYKEVKEEKISKNIILFVGRITFGKGIDLLFDALIYIKCNYSLYIVGDGEKQEIDKFKHQAQRLGILEHIKFCGYKTGQDLVEIYKEATLFVLPTREDCFGLVILEALCSLKPIICSKYAEGAYDMIEHNKNGLIIDPYNAQELGKSIENLLMDESKQKRFSLEDIDKRKKFTFEAVSKGYLLALECVLGK